MTIHEVSAVMRLVKPRPQLTKVRECRHGMMCYFPHDIYIGGALERYGEYVEAELTLLSQYINSGDVIVEAGANIGCDTVPIAKQVTDAGRVIAFEPQRIIHQMLCGNLAMNEIWNVIAERAALGEKNAVLRVPPVDYSKEGNFGGVSIGNEGEEFVQVIPLDAYQLGRCALIKIDVEGMELEVLKGAADTIKRLRPVLYVENDRVEKAGELIAYLSGLNYELHWHLPPMFSAENYRKNSVNDYQRDGVNIVSINMLCLPIEKKMTSTLPFVSRGDQAA